MRGRHVQFKAYVQSRIKGIKCSSNPVVREVEIGVDFQDIGGRLDVDCFEITASREADITSDSAIDAVDGKIRGPRRLSEVLIPL